MIFHNLPEPTPDAIFHLGTEFRTDSRPHRVDLVVGMYCDKTGSPKNLLACVQGAVTRNIGTPNYLPIAGDPRFLQYAGQLLFAETVFAQLSERTAQVQTAGGTGALSLTAELLRKTHPESAVFISDPTWPNHRGIFEQAGFQVKTYPYYNPETKTVDAEKMKEILRSMPRNSIVVLHACCHNPTGIDLTSEEWNSIIEIIKTNGLIPVLDSAYQGFGDGLEEDAEVVRKFAQADIQLLIAQSFSKSFHLYNSRIGALHVVCENAEEKRKVQGSLELLVRVTISNPPAEGSRIITTILGDKKSRALWLAELRGMRERIRDERLALATGLGEKFKFLLGQKGMFSYTGLTPRQVEILKKVYAIYMLKTGRMSIPGLNSGNRDYIVDSIREVVENTPTA